MYWIVFTTAVTHGLNYLETNGGFEGVGPGSAEFETCLATLDCNEDAAFSLNRTNGVTEMACSYSPQGQEV